MRIRYLLSSAAVTAALLSTSALVPDALAQKGITMTPSTDWAVTKVDERMAGGSAYCAIARRFERETILTIARNEMAETSFALDFQRPVFSAGDIFPVVLDPGAGEQRSYEINAVSNKAFVVRLGQDEAFFSALERTGHLRVEIGRKAYSFNLADIDSGQSRLNACVVSMVIPAAGDETLTPAPDPGASYRAEINMLRKQIRTLQEETDKLKSISDLGSTALPASSEDEAAVAELSKQIKTLEEENEDLKKRIEDEKKRTRIETVRVEEEPPDMTKLKAENDRLKQALKLVSSDQDTTLQDLQSEIDQLKKDNDRLNGALGKAKTSPIDQNQQELVSTLIEENERLTKELKENKTAKSDKSSELESWVEALNTENKELKVSLEKAEQARAKEAEEKIVELERENKSLKDALKKNGTSQTLVTELESQLKDLKARNTDLLARVELVKQEAQLEYDRQIEDLQSKNKSLKAALDGKEVDSELLANLSGQIKQMEEENKVLKESAGKSNNKQQELVSKMKEKIASLTTKLKEKDEELLSKSSAVNQEVVAEMQESINALKEELRVKEAKLIEAATKADSLSALEEKSAATKQAAAKMEESIVRLTAEIAEKDKKLAVLTERAGRIESLEIQNSTSEEAMLKLRKTVDELNEELQDKDAQLVELGKSATELEEIKSKNEELAKKIEDQTEAKEKLASTTDKLSGMKKKLAELRAVNKELESKLYLKPGAKLVKIAEQDQRVRFLENENTLLKDALDRERMGEGSAIKVAGTRAELETLKKQHKALLTKVESGVSNQGSASEELKTALAENERLRKELENRPVSEDMAELEKLKEENKQLRVSLKEKEISDPSVLAGANETLQKLEEENTQLKSEIETLKTEPASVVTEELAELKSKNDQLVVDLDKALKEAERAQTKIKEKEAEFAQVQKEKEGLIEALEGQGGEFAALAAAQSELESARKENETLKARIIELESAKDKIAALEKKVEELTQKNQKLQADLGKTKSDLVAALENKQTSAADQERIAKLERALRRADIDKQVALQSLAREYIRLKHKMHGINASVQEASAVEEGRFKLIRVASSESAPDTPKHLNGVSPMAGNEEGSQDSGPTAEELLGVQTVVQEEPAKETLKEQGKATPQNVETAKTQREILDKGSEEQDFVPFQRVFPATETEAQQREAELARDIEAVSAREPEPIEISRSEDPFENIEVKEQPVRYESVEGGRVEEKAAKIMEEENPSVETSSVQVVLESIEEISEKKKAPPPERVSKTYNPAFTVESILQKANIITASKIQFVEQESGPNQSVYQWRTDEIFGSAEQKPLLSEVQFESYVQSYLEKTKNRCDGDFAVVPDNSLQKGPTRIDSYEIACIGKTVDASASILFFNRGGTFTVVAHEAPTEDMDTAMDIRNRLLKTISGSS